MKSVLVFIVSILSISKAFAQQVQTTHLLKYSQKDGLPSYNVRKVVQDSKGFIWVGTQDGLSRFDGKSFLNYSKSSSRKNKICGVDVRELIEDSSQNLLWALPAEMGVNAINTITGEVVLTALMPKAGREDWNICMIRDGDRLLIGTSTGVKVYNISTNAYEDNFPLPVSTDTSVNFETRSVVKDDLGNIWACYSGYGIIVYDGKTKEILKQARLSELNDHDNSKDIRFYRCLRSGPGEILFATSQGLRKIRYTPSYDFTIDNFPCRAVPSFNTENVEYIYADRQNDIFIAGYNKLCRFDRSLQKYILLEEPAKMAETDWLNAVQCVFEDREDNIWLGCQEGLAFISKNPNSFTSFNYDRNSNTKLDHVRSVYVLDNGDILAGLRSGVVQIKTSTNRFAKYDTGHLYHHIFSDHNGKIIVSRPDGLFIYDNGKLTPIQNTYPEFLDYAAYPINSHLFINDTTVILGTENDKGILIWNPIRKRVKQVGSGNVNNIYKDASGRIWVLSDNVISILSPDFSDNKVFIPHEKQTSLPYKIFFDMSEAGGYYWIASYGSGILQLNPDRSLKNVLNTENGLSNNGVYQLYNIGDRQLLATTDNGLSVIDLDNLSIKTYFEKNGLHSNSFEEVAGIMYNKKIIAGGLNGFTIIDPEKFSVNHTPPVLYIRDLQIESSSGIFDTSNLLLNKINVPNNVLQTTIYFSAINYTDPGRTTISYRIKEQHPDWINIGYSNSLPLIGLSPGTYHLQIQAFNEDGVPSEIKELTLVFLPKWYQTWWFKLLLVMAVIGIAYGLYRIRINQLRKEQQIKTRLAGDLHDDLGSTMNSVKVYTNLALMEKEKEKYLLKIKESTQEAITGIKDMIWVLDDRKGSIEDLLSRVSLFASPLCEANNIQYKKEITDDARNHNLGQEEKRNLYMLLKEAVNNAAKYSEAKQVTIDISIRKGKPDISIKDNGKGFDTTKTTEGNGLKNMTRRAREIKYHIRVDAAPGKGVAIHLQKI